MKRSKLLIIPVCCMLLITPVSSMRASAVTVDINDNYDAGLIQQENDGNGKDEGIDTSTSASSASSSAASTATTTATQGTSTATPAAVSSTTDATPVATTTTTTTDLPKTGDDNRIMITFIAMLASFSIFLTALIGGRHFGKNAR